MTKKIKLQEPRPPRAVYNLRVVAWLNDNVIAHGKKVRDDRIKKKKRSRDKSPRIHLAELREKTLKKIEEDELSTKDAKILLDGVVKLFKMAFASEKSADIEGVKYKTALALRSEDDPGRLK